VTAALNNAAGRPAGTGALDLGAVLTPAGPAFRGSLEARLSPGWSAVAGLEVSDWERWGGYVGARARW
jgi:hypothetical protein